MAKKTIDIGALSKADQDAIQKQVEAAKSAGTSVEAARAHEALDFYYDVKEEIEAAVIKALATMPKKGGGTEPSKLAMKAAKGWSPNKILKIIANLPNKMPDKDEGYIIAARNIEVGKKKRPTKEQIEKKKQEALARKQEAARKEMFKKKESDRKAAAKKKKATPKKKSPAKK